MQTAMIQALETLNDGDRGHSGAFCSGNPQPSRTRPPSIVLPLFQNPSLFKINKAGLQDVER